MYPGIPEEKNDFASAVKAITISSSDKQYTLYMYITDRPKAVLSLWLDLF